MEEFYSTRQIADLLGIGFSTAKKKCASGEIKAVKFRNTWQVPKTAVAQCKVCGKWFIVTKSNRVYCSDDCRKAAHREQTAAWWKKTHPEKDPEPITAEECEQMCMDIPEPLPFEPEPPRMPEMVDMQKLYDGLCNGFSLFFEHLAEGMAEIAKGLKK